MENVSYFVLGSLCALGIFCLVYTLVEVLKMKKENQIRKENIEDLHNRLDEIIARMNSDLRQNENELESVKRYIDSRIDQENYKSRAHMNSFEDSFVRNLQTLESGLLDHSKRISDIETKISVAESAIENYQQINS